jgi:hypothetical protein
MNDDTPKAGLIPSYQGGRASARPSPRAIANMLARKIELKMQLVIETAKIQESCAG